MPMPLPKLSPLQARFAFSLAATLFVLLVYFAVFGPRLAYAADVDSIVDKDHNHPIPFVLDGLRRGDLYVPLVDDDDDGDEDIVERAPTKAAKELPNGEAKRENIDMGETQHWVFKGDDVAGPDPPTETEQPSDASERRSEQNYYSNDTNESDISSRDSKPDDTRLSPRAKKTVHITANTCHQPLLNATRVSTDAGPAQLRMYVSNSEDITAPGPDNAEDPNVRWTEFEGGFGSLAMETDGNVYVSIEAPNNTRYSGIYNYEIAAATNFQYHSVYDNSFLFFVDSDFGAALLQTNATTNADPGSDDYNWWMSKNPLPYTMFANSMDDPSILGLDKSFCGLATNAQVRRESGNVEGAMTTRGINKKPKQQFYVTGLNDSATYYGFLAMEEDVDASSPMSKGAKRLWTRMNFTTKAQSNCAVIRDLDFCSEVAYAVPSNPSLNNTELKRIYDTNAENLYKNFTRSLQQIPCDAGESSRYSLARTCEDCKNAYKQWLCAVTIPRCQDFSSGLPWLRSRNLGQPFTNGTLLPDDYPGRQDVLTNTSRNPIIDEQIKPGPYKEVLPCSDLCYELVKSCPSALGFGCPSNAWLSDSYGFNSTDGDIKCSYLGAAYFMNSAHRTGGPGVHLVSSLTLGVMTFWSLVWALWTL